MPTLADLSRRPAAVTADAQFQPWFAAVAARLLNGCDFLVAGRRYRLAEVEMYYSGPGHHDPFSHREPVQLEHGRWYFHKTRGEYRGGSFKGLDLVLGDGSAFFGVLIRTVVQPEGAVLAGPSLTVDHVLAQTKAASVAVLDSIIAGRSIWDTSSPLAIVDAEEPRDAPIYATSRVGLSLKRARGRPEMPRFLGRWYRFLTEPAEISKGKVHLVAALHRAGLSPEAIREVTGMPRKTIDRYLADFALGAHAENFDAYVGKDLSTGELCQLLGTWYAKFGTNVSA
jgi:hypothetical protein